MNINKPGKRQVKWGKGERESSINSRPPVYVPTTTSTPFSLSLAILCSLARSYDRPIASSAPSKRNKKKTWNSSYAARLSTKWGEIVIYIFLTITQLSEKNYGLAKSKQHKYVWPFCWLNLWLAQKSHLILYCFYCLVWSLELTCLPFIAKATTPHAESVRKRSKNLDGWYLNGFSK